MNKLDWKHQIKFKIIFLFSAFTFILLTTVFLYLYISGKSYLYNSAADKTDNYKLQFESILNEKLQDSYFEITALINQISARDLNRREEIEKSLSIQVFKNFLLGYPHKYSEFQFIYNSQKRIFTIRPQKLITGEIKIISDWIRTEDSPNSFRDSFEFNLNMTERKFDIYFPINNSEVIVLAKLKLSNMIERILDLINISNSTSIIITDSSGVIHYASEPKYINRNITHIDQYSKIDFDNLNVEQENNLSNSAEQISKIYYLSEINGYLILTENIGTQIAKLNELLWETILYTFLLFILVTLFVSLFSNRLSKPLNKITEVSQKVSEGDFGNKIEIKRKDEIGLLINTFNVMTVRLQQSYNELNKINVDLENKIEELTETKNELSRKEKLALIGETISVISHEIQNKIGGVSIWIQNLEMEVQDETSKIYITEMKKALDAFMDMLVNFKKFYRQAELHKIYFDVNEIIQCCLSNFQNEIGEKEISIETDFQTDYQKLFADKKQIEEALLNLIVNAIYYSPKCGKIIIQSYFINSTFTFSISNHGPQIPEEKIEKIFQPFYTTKSSGSGLGLALVNKIVEAHGGIVNVENNKENVTFKLSLPLEIAGEKNENTNC